MKSNIILGILAIVLSAMGCKTDCSLCKTDCCKDYPYDMHLSARELLQSFQDLAKKNGVSICNPGGNVNFSQTHNVSSAMSAAGYGGNNYSGIISFASFYYEDSTTFRTIWGGEPGNFTYYGACPPQPIIFNLPPVSQNHIYELALIPVTDYQAGTAPRSFTGFGGNRGVLNSHDITAIENIRLEPATGYINSNEPTLYSSEGSSKGFVCDVTIKGKAGKTPCYIINNHDDSATLRWKVKKECQ